MRQVELEALLFRIQNNYPSATVAQSGTAQEWGTSSIMRFSFETACLAFDAWRESALWPPTLADLISECGKVANASQQAALAAANFEDEIAYAAGELRTYGCGGCLDMRWLPMDPDDESRGVYPCPDCRPMVYERWKGGHYRPNHTCPECITIRSGRRHVA